MKLCSSCSCIWTRMMWSYCRRASHILWLPAYWTNAHPSYITPFWPTKWPLKRLWRTLETCTQHNSVSALFTFRALAMNLHFQSLVELKGGAPVVMLYGEPDVGKTTIANAAMSLLGIEACSFRGMQQESYCPSSLSNITGPHVWWPQQGPRSREHNCWLL